MGAFYEQVLRPIMFRQDPEKAHDLGVTGLEYLSRLPLLCGLLAWYNRPRQTAPIDLWGLRFPTAVGLAAGMDKNGRFWSCAAALGFGHVEIGTVTYHAQPGNERPRLFRYPAHRALINRMGFNNEGAEAMARRLKGTRRRNRPTPLGINIGKSKVVPLSEAVTDYLKTFHLVADYADYIAINVSSPNTPDLRQLQDRHYLPQLLGEIVQANQHRARKLAQRPVPLLLKIAPDLSFREIDQVLEVVSDLRVDGVIATNTTVDRPRGFPSPAEVGGLSGRPLFRKSLEVVNYIHTATAGKLPIIGVGGIENAVTAGAMLDAGASLVQIYTALIYRGPLTGREIARGLAKHHAAWL